MFKRNEKIIQNIKNKDKRINNNQDRRNVDQNKNIVAPNYLD
jgi:hypothetical protein